VSFDKRFFGIYRGLIHDSNDPEKMGRARIQVPQVLGLAITDWVECIVGNTEPEPNTPVWVMFEGGDPNFPLWIGSIS